MEAVRERNKKGGKIDSVASIEGHVLSIEDINPEYASIRASGTDTTAKQRKTTLVDSLIAYNRLISQTLSGTLRYLDYREDEQIRGITMKSSCISIIYEEPVEGEEENCGEKRNNELKHRKFLVNVVDSPGHLDFSGEFCAASRISDGALILIDAVEGVCTQTVQSLKEVWFEKIVPVFVINKMDRLITELKLEPHDAYKRINQIIEQVNAIIATLCNESNMDLTQNDTKYLSMFMQPAEDNVIFSSATDHWGFSVSDFATIYSKKLGFSKKILQKTLWGDYYIDYKKKKIIPIKSSYAKSLKPIFVQLVLENIWSIYRALIDRKDNQMIDRIISSLQVKVSPHDMKSKDRCKALKSLMGQWLPLAPAVLRCLTRLVPSPISFSESRMNSLFAVHNNAPESLTSGIVSCLSSSKDVVVYCPKVFLVDESAIDSGFMSDLTNEQLERRRLANIAKNNKLLSSNTNNYRDGENNYGDLCHEINSFDTKNTSHVVIGLARIYSGTIKCGQVLHVYGSNYNPELDKKDTYCFTVESLYFLMGKEYIEVKEVKAGNVFGIRLNDFHDYKNFIIASSFPGYININRPKVVPIVRVAVESQNPSEMNELVNGLKKLNQSDPSVEVYFTDTGEHIIAAAGELHLERCLDDLRYHFARISLQTSAPIVPFRETISNNSGISNFSNKCFQLYFQKYLKYTPVCSHPQPHASDFNTVTHTTPDRICTVKIQTWKIPDIILDILKNYRGGINAESKAETLRLNSILIDKLIECGMAVDKESNKHLIKWGEIMKRIIKSGPKNSLDNILVDFTNNYQIVKSASKRENGLSEPNGMGKNTPSITSAFIEPIRSGFDLAVSKGPLCDEQVTGVCFILKEFTLGDDVSHVSDTEIFGRITTTVRDACIRSIISWSLRLSLAMYSCDLLVPADSLGKVYAVLGKRGGVICSEELKEGTSLFEVKSKLPVVNSFGFAQEMRKRTSGIADPQMHFIGFECIDIDPFWVPTTEDELEDHGEKSDRENLAKKYIDIIRKRKGLVIDEKVVEFAEKQKNIKNK